MNTQKFLKSVVAFALLVSINTIEQLHAQVTLSWTAREDINIMLPSSIRVFETTADLSSGRRIRAYYALIQSGVDLRAIDLAPNAIPQSSTGGASLLAINGGFFTTPSGSVPSGSVSLIVKDGQRIARQIATLSRPGASGTNTTFFPTRAAFGVNPDGSKSVGWTYDIGNDIYRYTAPSPNRSGNDPQQQPTAFFPTAGILWRPQMAIGGGPMLVINGQKTVTTEAELFPADIPPPNPRTAIGFRQDGTTILVVVDGRRPGISDGCDLPELADIMLGLQCVGAINLDGGGSSAMVTNDQAVSIPSNTGYVQRAVASVVTANVPGFTPPQALVFDKSSIVYRETGVWTSAGADAGPFWRNTAARVTNAGTGNATAAFRFTGIPSGQYQVGVWWSVDNSRASNVPITLSGGANRSFTVNQSDVTTMNKWNILGTFSLTANDSLVISNRVNVGTVSADAVRLIPTTATSVRKLTPTAEPSISLWSVSPNPIPLASSSSARISFVLARSQRVSVVVTNILGQIVTRLADNQLLQSGEHTLTWSANVPQGMYIMAIQTAEAIYSQKVVVSLY